MIYTTQEELDAALAYWQKALRLQDWEIQIKIVPQTEIDGCSAQNLHWWKLKEAVVKIVKPEHWTASCSVDMSQDMEQDLVHELLHLHWTAWEPDSDDKPGYDLMEQTTEVLAKSIVTLKRKGDVSTTSP